MKMNLYKQPSSFLPKRLIFGSPESVPDVPGGSGEAPPEEVDPKEYEKKYDDTLKFLQQVIKGELIVNDPSLTDIQKQAVILRARKSLAEVILLPNRVESRTSAGEYAQKINDIVTRHSNKTDASPSQLRLNAMMYVTTNPSVDAEVLSLSEFNAKRTQSIGDIDDITASLLEKSDNDGNKLTVDHPFLKALVDAKTDLEALENAHFDKLEDASASLKKVFIECRDAMNKQRYRTYTKDGEPTELSKIFIDAEKQFLKAVDIQSVMEEAKEASDKDARKVAVNSKVGAELEKQLGLGGRRTPLDAGDPERLKLRIERALKGITMVGASKVDMSKTPTGQTWQVNQYGYTILVSRNGKTGEKAWYSAEIMNVNKKIAKRFPSMEAYVAKRYQKEVDDMFA